MILVLLPLFVLAVPAKMGVISVAQSDGTTIDIKRFGDENFRYTTTTDDYLISQSGGIYYYADISSDAEVTRSHQRARNPEHRDDVERQFVASRSTSSSLAQLRVASSRALRSRSSTSLANSASLSSTATRASGEVRGIVILVEFADEEFTYTNADFLSMLNDENYSQNGATGSARDYFVDNSMGAFQPSFDVVGPYTLSKPMAYYGANTSSGEDIYPRTMVSEACDMADDAGLDFSNYDSDNDGYVDMVFIFYAGHNEAEGASEDTIWPHMWSLASAQNYDGKSVYIYACTSELKGAGTLQNPQKEMAGIGTFAHEYGHTLGLADSYDTTGEEDGESSGLYTFDIMSTGSYNNDGSTPPYYCAYQRYELGWIEPSRITTIDNFELENISTNSAYIVETEVENEYFLFEYRNATERGMRLWDGYIGYNYDADRYFGDLDGLFITHIDRSSNLVGSYTASQLWYYNKPNGNLSHECARVVYSDERVTKLDMSSRTYETQLLSALFPNPSGNNSFGADSSPAALSWGGQALPIELSNIRTLNGTLYFTNGDPSTATEDEELDTNIYGEGYPLIYFEVEEWSDTHSTLKLSLRNIPEYDSVAWWLDGEEISSATYQIVSRDCSYRVVCEITTGEEVVRITKIIEL